jgi:Uncharacterized protein, probably involved in trehalose biosynthesis
MSWEADTAAAWQRHLEQARWFSGKGRSAQVRSLTALDWYTPPGSWPAVRSELITVGYPDGPDEVFQLLVGYAPAGRHPAGTALGTVTVPGQGDLEFFDATEDGDSLAAVIGSLRAAPGPGMRWLDAPAVDPAAPMRRYRGEQSNTTVMIGDGALLKLFRKLEPGANLDAEILQQLPGTITPRLFGVLTANGYDLGMFYERITAVTDGWVFATSAAAAALDFTDPARLLGTALAELHAELEIAFGTADRSGDDVAELMIDRYRAAAQAAPQLAQFAEPVAAVFGRLRGQRLATQRVHGDFHLGQALHRTDAAELPPWVIIDFEGEPLKSLAERRAFDSPVRDVAGALRSLDYARSAAADPSSPDALDWTAHASRAFLTGYQLRRPIQAAILQSYLLDKAIYEVVYEVRNRPSWAHIPLRAVQDELVRAQSGPTIRPKEF